jgi:hypothetical protein
MNVRHVDNSFDSEDLPDVDYANNIKQFWRTERKPEFHVRFSERQGKIPVSGQRTPRSKGCE